MLEEKNVFESICQIINDYLPGVIKEELKMDTVINNETGVDSLGFVLIISKLEALYNIKISDHQASKFYTIGDVVEFIKKKVEKKEAHA